ncbi:AEC family transporter [Acidovorax sp. Root219]|uniref:AEC family transporter n=1 Tax=Acidovorax sp. Root219 TaxID=1736493 RepID=UPI00070AE695|nr:AEC family transporter [Acidovorax sp. Root219]KRC30356.1 transporter [Acidovorax sp. Root219]
MLLRILSILFPLFAIAALGYAVGRRMKPDLSTANQLNLAVFVPALVFGAMAGKDFRVQDHLPLLLATLLLIAGTGVVGWLVARALGMQPKTLVPPMMFNNCGNLGLPLAVLAFGQEALAPAIAMFVVSNALQFSFGIWLLDHQARLRTVWTSPSILAAIAGLVVGMADLALWPPLLTAIRMVGDVSIPLMLFALGARLADSRIQSIGFGLFGAVLRPVAGMAIAWAVAWGVGLAPREQGLLLVFGALPPAVINFIFAERYRQEPEKVASMVLIGNLAALVFLPIALALTLQ